MTVPIVELSCEFGLQVSNKTCKSYLKQEHRWNGEIRKKTSKEGDNTDNSNINKYTSIIDPHKLQSHIW